MFRLVQGRLSRIPNGPKHLNIAWNERQGIISYHSNQSNRLKAVKTLSLTYFLQVPPNYYQNNLTEMPDVPKHYCNVVLDTYTTEGRSTFGSSPRLTWFLNIEIKH